MYLSPTESVKQYKVSKPTLYADMKSGKLSFNINARNRKEIMVAELERIYERRAVTKPKNDHSFLNDKNGSQQTFINDSASVDALVAVLQDQITLMKSQMESNKDEIEYLRSALERSQENQNKAMLLLEHEDGGAGSLEKSLKGLEARLTNQEQVAKEQREQNERLENHKRILRRKLKAEKEKSFWERLLNK